MEILLLCFVGIFILISYILRKKFKSDNLRYMYGSLAYKYLPMSFRKIFINEEERDILSELSSPHDYKKNLEDYTKKKLGTIMLVMILGTVFSVIFAADYIPAKNLGNIIKKPEFMSGKRKEKIKYKLSGKEGKESGFLDLELEEAMSEDEVMELLELRYEELLYIILDKNEDSRSVSKNLVFKDRPFKEDIVVKYSSSDEKILNNAGEIQRENTKVGEEYPVSLKLSLEYREQVLPVNIDLIIKRAAITLDEEAELLDDRIEESDEEMILPDTLLENEGEISWYTSAKGLSFLQLMASFGLIAIGVFYLYKKVLIERLESRKRSILLDLPDMINKLTLLIKAGFTPKKAWLIICDDYEKNKTGEKPLFEEMLVARNEILKGVSFEQMLLSFAKSCGNHQVMTMVSVLSQNMKHGSTMLIMALEQMGKEAWDMRVHQARILGEKASTRLLIPLGISFMVVILVIMSPLMMGMSI